MKKDSFTFKQFTVWQDGCAMKVGTDGTLLGAWAQVNEGDKVLDIGTGTGLIALMLAQRGASFVTAIDIDSGAVAQASANVAQSPWPTKVEVKQMDVADYAQMGERFNAVVSNPPFFQNSLTCPDGKRTMARHTEGLPFSLLVKAAYCLLMPQGTFQVVLPAEAMDEFVFLCEMEGFRVEAKTLVLTKQGAQPKRCLLRFVKGVTACSLTSSTLCIRKGDGAYSEEYKRLTSAFYLDK